MNKIPIILVALSAAVPGATALASTAHEAAAHTVKLQNVAIHPTRVVVKSGERVNWQFLDAGIGTEHNVTSSAHAGGLRFKSSTSKMSGTYSVTFHKRGTYYYECTIHPDSMRGTIVVR